MIERIAAQIADGLAFAHQHGVVHCDVKPANIVVLESGLVMITVFGIAMLPTGSRTFAGNLFGSPRYISPEQVMGRTVDARSDIFSLGVVLYEMLTGLPPFMATALPEILHQVIHEKAVAPSSRNPGIPSAFDYIVARAMAKQPEHRYQSALDMAFDLRKLALEEPGFAPVPAVALKAGPITRPRPSDDTVLLEVAGTLTRSGEPSGPPEEASASASMRQRRRMVVYGVPAALFAMGGWMLLSRYASNREEGTVTIHSLDRDAAHSVPAKIAPVASAESIAAPPATAGANASAAAAVGSPGHGPRSSAREEGQFRGHETHGPAGVRRHTVGRSLCRRPEEGRCAPAQRDHGRARQAYDRDQEHHVSTAPTDRRAAGRRQRENRTNCLMRPPLPACPDGRICALRRARHLPRGSALRQWLSGSCLVLACAGCRRPP
jgi:hypothetical protein